MLISIIFCDFSLFVEARCDWGWYDAVLNLLNPRFCSYASLYQWHIRGQIVQLKISLDFGLMLTLSGAQNAYECFQCIYGTWIYFNTRRHTVKSLNFCWARRDFVYICDVKSYIFFVWKVKNENQIKCTEPNKQRNKSIRTHSGKHQFCCAKKCFL